MPDAKISDLPAGGDPQDTDEFVVARGATNVSLAWSSLSNAATRNNLALTISGNTAGVGALVSSGTITLAGGPNITVSQAGNAISISGPAAAAETQTAISGIANSQTTYTSGTVSLSELGAITIRSTTGNQYQFSVNAQSVQPETQTFLAGLGNSQTTYTSGTVNLSVVAGNLTIRSTTGQAFQFSASQTVQPETQTFIGGIAASNTTYTSGTVTITGVGGGITVSSNTGQRVDLSVAAQSAQTQGILNAGVSTGGNTSGDTTVNSGTRLVFVGSNNITLSQGTAANATTITISGPAAGGVFSGGMSTMGNTSGDTGYATQRLNLVGGNNITLSGSTNAGSMSITISAPNLGAGAMSAGVSNLGNTEGSTGITGTQLVLVGTHDLTLSQSTGANGGTVTFVHGPTIGMFCNLVPQGDSVADPRRTHAFTGSAGSLGVFPLILNGGPFPGLMTCNTFYFKLSLSGSTATMSQAFSSSFSFGVYTRTGSTLSLLNSASTSFGSGAANANLSTVFAGNRYLTLGTAAWSSSPVFVPGVAYYMATNWRSSGVLAQSGTVSAAMFLGASNSVSHSGTIGVATANATSMGLLPWFGVYTATTAAMPTQISSNQLNKQVVPAIFAPILYMNQDQVQSF